MARLASRFAGKAARPTKKNGRPVADPVVPRTPDRLGPTALADCGGLGGRAPGPSAFVTAPRRPAGYLPGRASTHCKRGEIRQLLRCYTHRRRRACDHDGQSRTAHSLQNRATKRLGPHPLRPGAPLFWYGPFYTLYGQGAVSGGPAKRYANPTRAITRPRRGSGIVSAVTQFQCQPMTSMTGAERES